MDFSCSDISPTKVVSTPSPTKSANNLKNITVSIQLFVTPTNSQDDQTTTYWPLGIAVGNSYSLKKLLEVGSKFPKDLGILRCSTKIMYPERIRREMREITFSENILNEFSFDDLTRLPWLSNQVITFVTDQTAETVMESFEMIKSLHLADVINPVEERVKIHIKVLPTLEIKPVDLPVIKYLVKQITEARSESNLSLELRDTSPIISTFVIIGSKRKQEADSSSSSASSKQSKTNKKGI